VEEKEACSSSVSVVVGKVIAWMEGVERGSEARVLELLSVGCEGSGGPEVQEAAARTFSGSGSVIVVMVQDSALCVCTGELKVESGSNKILCVYACVRACVTVCWCACVCGKK
jgi:hypothetical protein